MINWIKDKLGISTLKVAIDILEKENAQLRAELNNHRRYVKNKVADLKAYTRADADIGVRGNNTIILTGVYRRQAYVRFWDVGDGEFARLIEQLREMKDHCLIRNIDKPPSMRGMFEI